MRHVAVRDFLRSHPDEAAQYAALKRELAKRHPQDRLAYSAGKDRYVKELEARALAERSDAERRPALTRAFARRGRRA